MSSQPTIDVVGLRSQYEAAGQGHVFRFWDELSEEQRSFLASQLQTIDPVQQARIFEKSMSTAASATKKSDVHPPKIVIKPSSLPSEQVHELHTLGTKLIAQGKVALVLLAGGQGTRLGTTDPKGMYDIGLPSHKSLYQVQAEKLQTLQKLVAQESSSSASPCSSVIIPWYIMTSPFTHDSTVNFFKSHSYFGLDPSNVFFFEQADMPCFSNDGKLLLEAKHKLALAPDGNGGIYAALEQKGVLADMKRRGIEHIHAYCVDNILVKVADPIFIGTCASQESEVGAKVMPKAYAEEPVGVFCMRDNTVQVVEYSEIPKEMATAVDPETGIFRFNAGNIANHYYTLGFLERAADIMKTYRDYHVARKKIPFLDEQGVIQYPSANNGVKLELFIFDVFQFSPKVSLMEICRAEEFSPVKNAPGAPLDSPDTARRDVSRLHKQWIEAAGGKIVHEEGIPHDQQLCEVSSLVSYGGEGLAAQCAGKSFTLPLHMS